MATPPDHHIREDRAQIAVTLRTLGALLLELGDLVRRLPLWQGRAVYDPETDEPRNDEARIEGRWHCSWMSTCDRQAVSSRTSLHR